MGSEFIPWGRGEECLALRCSWDRVQWAAVLLASACGNRSDWLGSRAAAEGGELDRGEQDAEASQPLSLDPFSAIERDALCVLTAGEALRITGCGP